MEINYLRVMNNNWIFDYHKAHVDYNNIEIQIKSIIQSIEY